MSPGPDMTLPAVPAEWEQRLAAIGETLYPMTRIAAEIQGFTQQSAETVWRRLCLEMEQSGTAVVSSARALGVTPHVFDDRMVELYRTSDGFIYETLVESRNPHRKGKWLNAVRYLLNACALAPAGRSVLMYGDSVGSDALFLAQLGFTIAYHDYDSYCARFARWRFEQRGLPMPVYDPQQQYDFVVCLEVAEHAPDPLAVMRELAGATRPDGLIFFSEAFDLVIPTLPTHLASNARYAGQADAMFAGLGFYPIWRDIDRKPVIFRRGAPAAPTAPTGWRQWLRRR